MVQVVNWSQAPTNHGTSGALVPGPHKPRYKWRIGPRPHKPRYKWCTGPWPPQTTVQVAHWSQAPQTTVQVAHWSQAPQTTVQVVHWSQAPQTTVQVAHWYQSHKQRYKWYTGTRPPQTIASSPSSTRSYRGSRTSTRCRTKPSHCL